MIKTCSQCGKEFRCLPSDAPQRKFCSLGCKALAQKKPLANLDELIARYEKGESIRSLAIEAGIYDALLGRHFHERGVTIRGCGTYPPHVEAAHAARRGQKESLATKEVKARTREQRQTTVSVHERTLGQMLSVRGLKFTPQKAISKYNVDFALTDYPVVVEMRGGSYSELANTLLPARTEYLLSHGWHLIEIFLSWARRRPEILNGAADRIDLFALSHGSAIPSRGEHLQIRPDGQDKDHNFSPYTISQ